MAGKRGAKEVNGETEKILGKLQRGKIKADSLLVAKTVRGEDAGDGYRMEGGIVLPENATSLTNYVEIIAVGENCKAFTAKHSRWGRAGKRFGETVFCPELANQMHYVGRAGEAEYWFFRESAFSLVLIRDDKLIPLADWVVIEANAEAETLRGGIAISDGGRRLPNSGVVQRLGKKCRELASGQTVLFPRESVSYRVVGKTLVCVREKDVLCTIS